MLGSEIGLGSKFATKVEAEISACRKGVRNRGCRSS